MTQISDTLIIRDVGRREYEPLWREMQAFNLERDETSADELWLVEHPPVFTLGMNGKPEHVLDPGDIPLIDVDRGGQVTYHGPGQIVAYTMIDLQRKGIGIRELVSRLEQAIIEVMAESGIDAQNRADAPGVYVDNAKIAALGLRVKRGCTYHGLSFNVDMDLEPFTRINPCGYPNLTVTQVRDLQLNPDLEFNKARLVRQLIRVLGYNRPLYS